MQVILDFGRRRVFHRPLQIIHAAHPDQVPAALDALEAALAAGRYVAGWMAYELGYALEPRLAPAMPDVPGPLIQLGVYEGISDGAQTLAAGRSWCGPLRLEWDGAAYGARFAAVKDYIAAGDIYQANLSFRARFGFLGDPLALYEHLRAESGAGFCGYADDGHRQIASISPELFFALKPDGKLTARPMKGTLARGQGDARARAALAASQKDRAENLMIVDLIRNDLGRVAQTGSVAVNDLFAVETYPTLHTMVSTVTAQRRASCGPADLLRALFPCGSVTGAPKIRAMEVLRELETSPRGVYCGALGYFAPAPASSFSAMFNVSIRTLTINGMQGELGIGGGVVQDSRQDGEYDECLLKARFFEGCRRPLGLIETLRWDGMFTRLDAHLARMAASARVFELAFDAAAARAALEKAVAGHEGARRVRLALDENGGHAVTVQALAPNPPHWCFALSPRAIHSADPLLRHKTDWRELYDGEAARLKDELGADEAVFCNERGEVCEGARSNIFVARGGTLLTPPLASGLLPGVLRAQLLAEGRAREAVLTPDDLKGEVWFGNSLRGLIKGVPVCPPRGRAR